MKRLDLGATVARTHMVRSGHRFPPACPQKRSQLVHRPSPHALGPLFDAGIVPDVAVELLLLELIGWPATTFVVVNRFDCATAHPFNGLSEGEGVWPRL